MPAPQKSYSTFSTTNTSLPTTTETVVATLAGLNTQFADAPINLLGWAAVTTGTGVTSLQARLRRAGLTGAVVGELATVQIGAGLSTIIVVQATDFPGEVASQVYVLTLQQVAATGAGSADTVSLTGIVGN